MKSFCVYEDKIKKFLSFCAFMLLSNLSAKHISKSPWKKYRERERYVEWMKFISLHASYSSFFRTYRTNDEYMWGNIEEVGGVQDEKCLLNSCEIRGGRQSMEWEFMFIANSTEKNAAKRSYRIIGNIKKGK